MPPSKRKQNGNAFMFVLLGVALFAAFVFVVSSGLNTGTTKLTASQARERATDTIVYAEQIDRAVHRVYDHGISENDLSFENPTVSGYEHTPAVVTAAQIFNSNDGGRLGWRDPLGGTTPDAANTWLFTGDVVLTGQGDDSKSDLLLVLPVMSEVCTEINRQLNTGIDLGVSVGTVTGAKFTGTFAENPAVAVDPSVIKSTGCVKGLITDGVMTGAHTFFKVLLVR